MQYNLYLVIFKLVTLYLVTLTLVTHLDLVTILKDRSVTSCDLVPFLC